jgi:peptidyl-tRNA hydrolase
MPPGKAASQAGHAFLDSFLKSPPDIQKSYLQDGGTKIVLLADDEVHLRALHMEAERIGLPCALVVESGHILPPVFDGSPIITALGIGPVMREMGRSVTGDLPLM